ncbi:MAG: DUF2139 domain-containing protein [Desulfurococcaceae archaeon]
MVVKELYYPPRYGPEWGSGGIFGLKYHRGVLYYTLAFEAIAHFIRKDEVKRYRFELVGSPPASGGDTYNAVDAVDEFIYFGGWVHAPAIYKGKTNGESATISFVNKYSHVHEYDISNDNVRILWKESIHHETDWVGEISEIIYDPVNDRLLLARADGMVNLGVYQLNRRGGEYKKLSELPALKGAIFHDYACFDALPNWKKGASGIQCLELTSNKSKKVAFDDYSKRSLDGDDVNWPITGVASTTHGRFFLFVRGGVFIGNPIDESIEPVTFVRMFDFVKSGYYARRTMAKPVGGGILVAFNAYSEALLYPTDSFEEFLKLATNTIVGPSVLVYITPPVARIVGAFGARITGFELVKDKLVLATSNMANTGRYDATPIDTGYRSILMIDQSILSNQPPPVRFSIKGIQVENKTFGGIPLAGYKEPRLIINSSIDNKVTIYGYDLSLPLQYPERDVFAIGKGKNIIELKSYGNSIVAFKLEKADLSSVIKIDLL